MNELETFIIETKTKLMVQQGQIEILMGLLSNKVGKDEFMSYLKFITDNPCFGKEAKFAASEMIHQDSLWTADMLSGKKQ